MRLYILGGCATEPRATVSSLPEPVLRASLCSHLRSNKCECYEILAIAMMLPLQPAHVCGLKYLISENCRIRALVEPISYTNLSFQLISLIQSEAVSPHRH